jgi:tRNA (mo5U34)-methyltransferase
MQQTRSSEETQARIAELGPWFHNVRLPDGTQTFPDHWLGDFPRFKWEQLAPHLPADLDGWTVLDIGCNAGFYSFELAKRGALVTGIDVGPHYLAQAKWLAAELGLEDRVRFERMQVYDLAHTPEQYDLVLFMGVFYHLRYPMLGLDVVCQKVRQLLVFQTLSAYGDEVAETPYDLEFFDREPLAAPGWPKMAFLEHRMAGDPTNWWVPNKAACEAMLRSAGMRIIGHPLEEGYLCEPDQDRVSVIQTWDRDEYISATGQPWLRTMK